MQLIPILAVGDSKARMEDVNILYDWKTRLVNDLSVQGVYFTASGVFGRSGFTTLDAFNEIDAWLITWTAATPPQWVLWDLGDNDTGDPTVWLTRTLYVLDALHTKWPSAKIRMAHLWCGNGCAGNSWNTHIDDAIAARPVFVDVGMDENIELKGSDNGASETYDLQHPNEVGAQNMSNGWKIVIGF